MKLTVYIETTIPSFLTARNPGDLLAAGEQEATRRWWNNRRQQFDLFISQPVLEEAAMGDVDAAKKRLDALEGLPLLNSDDAVEELTDVIMASGVIPAKAKTDAVHVCAHVMFHRDLHTQLTQKKIA